MLTTGCSHCVAKRGKEKNRWLQFPSNAYFDSNLNFGPPTDQSLNELEINQ